MTQHAHTQDQGHPLITSEPLPISRTIPLMEVRTYFDAARRLGHTYNAASAARIDVLSVLQTPTSARLPLRCERMAQRLAGTAREWCRDTYWWASDDTQTKPYRLADLDRQQPLEELTGSLHGLCEQLRDQNATLADLAPVLALMAMDLLRLAAAHERVLQRGTFQDGRRSA